MASKLMLAVVGSAVEGCVDRGLLFSTQAPLWVAWASSQHWGWVPGVSVLREQSGNTLHFYYQAWVTWHHFCHNLLAKAVTESTQFLNEGTQMDRRWPSTSKSIVRRPCWMGGNSLPQVCWILWPKQNFIVCTLLCFSCSASCCEI